MTSTPGTGTASEQTPMDRMADAVAAFVNSIDDQAPVLLRGGVVVWESMILDDDGSPRFRVMYTTLPNTSLASAVGMLDLGKKQITTHALYHDAECDHDDD